MNPEQVITELKKKLLSLKRLPKSELNNKLIAQHEQMIKDYDRRTYYKNGLRSF